MVANWFPSLTCWSTQGAVVEEAIGGIMTATAHSSSAISVEVGLTLFLKVGCRGLGTGAHRWDMISQKPSKNKK